MQNPTQNSVHPKMISAQSSKKPDHKNTSLKKQTTGKLWKVGFLALLLVTLPTSVFAQQQDAKKDQPTAASKKQDNQTIGMKHKVPSHPNLHPLVPGSGFRVAKVGDDFEAEDWKCELNLPKSSHEIDGQRRFPGAVTSNGRWFEGAKRGTPDVVKRVATPEGGPKGSKGAMLLKSLSTGVPNRLSFKSQQDDFVCNVQGILGGAITASQSPSCVIHVFLPKFETWERRSGAHFGFRMALSAQVQEASGGGRFFRGGGMVTVQKKYWPGMFIDLTPANPAKNQKDSVKLRIRGNIRGFDIPAIPLEKSGWWTLGMSVTSDGAVHYYARPGVGKLTEKDHITSQTPYNYRAKFFHSFFLNVVNGDDGKNWSTPMIIDDAYLYFVPPGK